ncbi:MAG: hypothetical protein ABJQ29_00510 [Luteolibacter sp.]
MYLDEMADNLIAKNLELEDQIAAMKAERCSLLWVDADKWLPHGAHEVLATDLEGRFLACWHSEIGQWLDMDDEPFDSTITHWMELPELPEA